MPMIMHDGENMKTYQVELKTKLFLGNINSKGTFLIQYPHDTYLEFMKWCYENLSLRTTQKSTWELKVLVFLV